MLPPTHTPPARGHPPLLPSWQTNTNPNWDRRVIAACLNSTTLITFTFCKCTISSKVSKHFRKNSRHLVGLFVLLDDGGRRPNVFRVRTENKQGLSRAKEPSCDRPSVDYFPVFIYTTAVWERLQIHTLYFNSYFIFQSNSYFIFIMLNVVAASLALPQVPLPLGVHLWCSRSLHHHLSLSLSFSLSQLVCPKAEHLFKVLTHYHWRLRTSMLKIYRKRHQISDRFL